MTYASITAIKADLKAHENNWQNDDTVVDDAILTAERMVNGELGIIQSIPSASYWGTDSDAADKWDILVQAANLYAKGCIMDDLYSTKSKRSPSAEAYEKKALIVLKPMLSG